MAYVIESTKPYDTFRAKCAHCGREFIYERREISHYPKAESEVIYCPICKTLVAHNEANLVQEATQETVRRAQMARRRDQMIRKYRVPKILLLAFGIPTIVVGAFLTILFAYFDEFEIALAIGLTVFPLGLAMTILGGIFARKLRY